MGAEDFKSAAVLNQHEQDSLQKLEERIASMEQQTLATVSALAQQVKNVGGVIGVHMQA